MTNQNPEQRSRDTIDDMLRKAGWSVQDKGQLNWSAGPGVALREYQTSEGPADYVLFVDRKPVGVIEAKREERGESLSAAEEQAEGYRTAKLKHIDNDSLPFSYESTGTLTYFTDHRDPKPRARCVFHFHRPETLREWLRQDQTLRARLHNIPSLNPGHLRLCQINAITNLEQSFREARPKALVQMATGSGKTFTAITAIYRLLKFANAKRVLFLVDTRNLGEQAEQEFMKFEPDDDKRKFTELYNVQRLNSRYVAPDSQVCISTIQRLYSILKDEELDERAEQDNPNETHWQPKEPVPVGYNDKIPIEFFDFIVVDECHRSIYNLWKQVLDYFDAFMIGLTATPDARTYGFFNENVVSEYPHEQAVIDGVNVGYDVYVIETKISKEGAQIKAKEYIEYREKLSRRQRWEMLDEDKAYSAKELDRDVVNPSQIRRIIKSFREKLPEIFPGRNEVPKTLIFAKTDSHAEDIIRTVREEFAEGNEFCKKITYQSQEDPKSVLQSFRNDYYPRIAVTVDMIATGTDVKPLECLLFMRDVKSRNYFEQMKGRGTRTLAEDDLRKVTPSARHAKSHFVIVDAVGVTKSLKTDSRPLERKPSVPLKDLLGAVLMGARDEDLYTSLANRLIRLERMLTEQEKADFIVEANGRSPSQIAAGLLAAYDPDRIEEKARAEYGEQPGQDQLHSAQEALIEYAARPFSGPLNDYIENVRRVHEQLIDDKNLDELQHAGWDTSSGERGASLVKDFQAYVEEHRDEIAAFRIFYDQPYHQRKWTYQMVKEILDHLKRHKPHLAPLRVYEAYAELDNIPKDQPKKELIALVSLLRRVTGMDQALDPYDVKVRRNFRDWVFQKQVGPVKFNQAQMDWLYMVRDHIAASVSISMDDLDYAPFDAQGGRGKMFQLFGEGMGGIIEEMNIYLAG